MFKPGDKKLPNAGRKKGTPNKKMPELMILLEENNFNPGEELVYCYREARRIFEFRKRKGNLAGALIALDQASSTAEKISQYVYPRKKAIEHSGEVGVKTFADFIAAAHKKAK